MPIEKQYIPREAEMILSAMDAGVGESTLERRENERMSFRVRATLKLFSDAPDAPAWELYTRDANSRGLGFICPHRLPLGYGGWVELESPTGRMLKIHCTLFRCRETVQGWYDCALYFNREQPAFAVVF